MTKTNAMFEPKGFRFFDRASGREMILIDEDQHFTGWLCYRHTDGQWVTLREATEADRIAIGVAIKRSQDGLED